MEGKRKYLGKLNINLGKTRTTRFFKGIGAYFTISFICSEKKVVNISEAVLNLHFRVGRKYRASKKVGHEKERPLPLLHLANDLNNYKFSEDSILRR